jgi:hypothetical protein
VHIGLKEIDMPVMLIAYDRTKIIGKVDRVLAMIKSYNYVQLSESTFAIENFEKTRTVFNKIMQFLVPGTPIVVITLIKPFSGPVLAPVSEWFSKYLPEE